MKTNLRDCLVVKGGHGIEGIFTATTTRSMRLRTSFVVLRPGGVRHAVPLLMKAPVDITFRAMEPSPAVVDAINEWAARLEHSFERIERCAVIIEIPHRHQRQGNTFHVRIELTVPHQVITVSRDPGLDDKHEDVYVAIADAFRAARRQLQDHARVVRGDVKLHV